MSDFFSLRGVRGDQMVTLTWREGGVLSGDPDAVAMVHELAEHFEGRGMGQTGGPYTTHNHLKSPYTAREIMCMVFNDGRPELVAGALPPLPDVPKGAIR